MTANTSSRPRRRLLLRALYLGAGTLALGAAPVGAETLQEALESAYSGNPTITAQRAVVRAADENVPIARAAGLPSLDGTITYQENVLKGERPPGGFFSEPDRQIVGQLNGNIPLLTFGAVRAAEARVSASHLGLRATESELFTAVVGAYMDVIRDEAVVRLNRRNTEVMGYTLEQTRQRNRVGELGPTDVAQTEARESLAVSQLETAQARLVSSRENYIRLVGRPPGDLTPPPPLPPLPATAEAAVEIALKSNPDLLAAQAERDPAAQDVEVAHGEGRPKLNAIAGLNQYDYLNSLDPGTGPRNGNEGTTGFVGMQLRLPFYQGGRIAAQVRQAQARHGGAIEQVTVAERNAVAQTRSAFATWKSARRVIVSAERGVTANQRALEGLRAETNAGVRPLLDRLNAEQELLNSQVTLVTAQRDEYVAGFALLAAMGMAEAKDLSFETSKLYDPEVNYNRVRNRFMGISPDPDPEPVATGTAQSPPQDAEIGALEPLVAPAAR